MIIAFVFLLFDGTIRRHLDKQKWRDSDKENVVRALSYIGQELSRLEKPNIGIPESERRRLIQKLKRRREYLQKQLT